MDEKPDMHCTHCGVDLQPESALMQDSKPYCDEFCRDEDAREWQEKLQREADADDGLDELDELPLVMGLHLDGTVHIYTYGDDSGLSIEIADDGTLLVRVDESKPAMMVVTQ